MSSSDCQLSGADVLPIPPYEEVGVESVFGPVPPIHPTPLLNPTFLTTIQNVKHGLFIVTEEEYAREVEKATRLGNPVPHRYDSFPLERLEHATLPITYVSTDTVPPKKVYQWWPSAHTCRAQPGESKERRPSAPVATVATTNPPAIEKPMHQYNHPPVLTEVKASSNTTVLQTTSYTPSSRINPNAEEFVPSTNLIPTTLIPLASPGYLHGATGSPVSTCSFAKSSLSPTHMYSAVAGDNTYTKPQIATTPPIIMATPSAKTVLSNKNQTYSTRKQSTIAKAIPATPPAVVEPTPVPAATPAPVVKQPLSYASAAATKKEIADSNASNKSVSSAAGSGTMKCGATVEPTSRTKSTVIGATSANLPAQKAMINDLLAEYAPFSGIPMCGPDNLNYQAYKANRFKEPSSGADDKRKRLYMRMCCLDQLIKNEKERKEVRFNPGGPIKLSPSAVKVHSLGFSNRSDKNECYINTVIQSLLSIPVFVRYILSAGRCPKPDVYPMHASLFRLFCYVCGVMKKEDILAEINAAKGKRTNGPYRSWTEDDAKKLVDYAQGNATNITLHTPPANIKVTAYEYLPEAIAEWGLEKNRDAQEDADEFLGFILTSLENEVSWEESDSNGSQDDGFTMRPKKGPVVSYSGPPSYTGPIDLLFGIVKRDFLALTKLQSSRMRSWIVSPDNAVFKSYQTKNGKSKTSDWTLSGLLSANLQDGINEAGQKWEHRSKFDRLPPVLYIMVARSNWDNSSRIASKNANKLPPPRNIIISTDYLVDDTTLTSDLWKAQNLSKLSTKSSMLNGEVTLSLESLRKGADPNTTGDSIGASYDLASCMIHTGDYTGSGHYLSMAQRNGKYWLFDDDSIESADGKDESNEGYVLLYTRSDVHDVVLECRA